MGRLIDADELTKNMMQYFQGKKTIGQIIDEQPTAYDVDKVVEQLKNIAIEFETFGIASDYVELSHAIEIVKAGGIAKINS